MLEVMGKIHPNKRSLFQQLELGDGGEQETIGEK